MQFSTHLTIMSVFSLKSETNSRSMRLYQINSSYSIARIDYEKSMVTANRAAAKFIANVQFTGPAHR